MRDVLSNADARELWLSASSPSALGSSGWAAATALALTIGLTVVTAVAVTAASLKDSVSEAVSGGNRSDLILEPAGAGMGISPSVAELLPYTAVLVLTDEGPRILAHLAAGATPRIGSRVLVAEVSEAEAAGLPGGGRRIATPEKPS